MADSSSDSWQILFFGGAAAFILYQMFRGWQLGVVRVLARIIAVVAAYAAAWFAAPQLVPVLQPLGLPNPVLLGIGGGLVGLLVFAIVSLTSAMLFKKTSDQTIGAVRLGFGAGGSLLGMCVGIFLVWIAVLGVRVLGTLASPGNSQAGGEPNKITRGLVQMKDSLEHGPAGAVLEQVDPIPGTVYSTIEKIGRMTARQENAQRFMEYPGVAPLVTHPKMAALRDNPQIARYALEGNFFALMRNPHVVSAANDPELIELIKKLEFQKALDYAVSTPDNRPVPRQTAP